MAALMSVTHTQENLPPFSGLDTSCKKCGEPQAGVTWHSTNRTGTNFPCQHARKTGEHMCRVCSRCGFGWMEQPQDANTGEEEHEHCFNCGVCGCAGYCDDYQTYNLRPAETGGDQ